jgi:nickel/cobalt exporter
LAGQTLSIEVFEDGVPPRWRIQSKTGDLPSAADVLVTTIRADGGEQIFAFAARDG